MGQTPSTQIQPMQQLQKPMQQMQQKLQKPMQQMQQKLQQMQPMPKLNNISFQDFETMKQSARKNYEGVQRTLENSGKYKKLKSMGRDAFDNIQNIQKSNFVQGLNAKMQEKMNDIIQKIKENIKMMKDDLKVETITDLATILIKSGKDEWVNVGNLIIQETDNIREKKNLLTGGGKYKSKKNNRTKKHKKSSKNNRTIKHKKSKKHNRTKKKR
jgi:hypothetical protein